VSRVKTFDATGVAPNGRLFAGDLNLIQDQYADRSNFLQTVDVGTLRVGDGTIQILKYGAAEIRASSALRTDGILRGLGGLFAGAYTTTQRDAIASGFRPYGLVILNTTNNRYEWNIGTDAAPIWQGLGGNVASGTLLARPAASSANANTLYFATDDNGGTWYLSNGTTWLRVTKGLSSVAQGTLGSRPAANTVPTGNVYVATDDHGGTSWESDGTTWQKMAASINGEVPIGGVFDWPWAIGVAPVQCAALYGQAISRTAFPDLNAIASASGYPHGAGDGSTTFNLPDYRGRIGAGLDNMGGTAANRITAAVSGIAGTTLGANGGAQGITLSTAQMPAHAHGGFTSGPLNSSGTAGIAIAEGGGGQSISTGGGGYRADNSNGVHIHAIGAEGGGQAHANVQPSIMVNKVMRVV
jgi:microcystin-dependent protein